MPLRVNISDNPYSVKELAELREKDYASQLFEFKRRVESDIILAALEPANDKNLDTGKAIRCFWWGQKKEFFFILSDLLRAFYFFRGTPRIEDESRRLRANIIRRFKLRSIKKQAEEEGKDVDDYRAWIGRLSALDPRRPKFGEYCSISWNGFVQALREESNYSLEARLQQFNAIAHREGTRQIPETSFLRHSSMRT